MMNRLIAMLALTLTATACSRSSGSATTSNAGTGVVARAKCAEHTVYFDAPITHQECADPPIRIETEVTCMLPCAGTSTCYYVHNDSAFPTTRPALVGTTTYTPCGPIGTGPDSNCGDGSGRPE